jgi:hypothetical protein
VYAPRSHELCRRLNMCVCTVEYCVEGSCRVAYFCLCRECYVEGSCKVAFLCLCSECCVEESCKFAYLCYEP